MSTNFKNIVQQGVNCNDGVWKDDGLHAACHHPLHEPGVCLARLSCSVESLSRKFITFSVQYYLATMLSIQAYLERGDGPIVLVMAPTRFLILHIIPVFLNWLTIITLSFQRAGPTNPRTGYQVCRALWAKVLSSFIGLQLIQGWIKSRLPVLFRTDSFKTHIDYRQFQTFLLVIDSFGLNRCGKYVLKSFRILINQPAHTSESVLYWKSNASWWYSSTLLDNIELCIWTFW